MKWKKLGLIFCPDKNHDWMVSHASYPIAVKQDDNTHKIFFSCRDSKNISSIGYVIIALKNPTHIIERSSQPVLSPGEIGMFDDSGISIGCIVPQSESLLLYYMGWNLGVTALWRNSIGLAMSDKLGFNFKRYSEGPILDRNPIDPTSISYPFVIKEENRWRMWYGSNLKWGKNSTDMKHVIKYASSNDGIHWDRCGDICINFKNSTEYAISKPCVIKDGNLYKMWYSYRGNKYRIGYAESSDGVTWNRMDEKVGIDVSSEGWDSEMIEYPFVFDHKGQRYMLYNGNGYGRTGLGLAILEDN